MKKIEPYFRLYNKKTNRWYNDIGIYPRYNFLVLNDNDAMAEIADSGENEDWNWYLDEDEIDIDDLYFGCLNYNFNSGKMEKFNLFQSFRVLESIAIYRTRQDELVDMNWLSGEFDPLSFCFGDLRGHVEYEMQVGGPFQDKTSKLSLWDMYVVPNADLLMSMVNSVSVESCKEWLKENKR